MFGSNPLILLLPGFSQPLDFNSEANYPNTRPDDIYPRPFFEIPKPNSHNHDLRPLDPSKPDPIGPYRPDAGYNYMDKFELNRPGSGFLRRKWIF